MYKLYLLLSSYLGFSPVWLVGREWHWLCHPHRMWKRYWLWVFWQSRQMDHRFCLTLLGDSF